MLIQVPDVFLDDSKILRLPTLSMLHYFDRQKSESVHVKIDHYLRPWAGVGYSEKTSGSNRVGDEVFKVPSVVGLVTLHVGYKS